MVINHSQRNWSFEGENFLFNLMCRAQNVRRTTFIIQIIFFPPVRTKKELRPLKSCLQRIKSIVNEIYELICRKSFEITNFPCYQIAACVASRTKLNIFRFNADLQKKIKLINVLMVHQIIYHRQMRLQIYLSVILWPHLQRVSES